jgi:tRNA threonylcarbamoyladenosine biosynthesis protein TsaB
MALILNLETATPVCSVALSHSGQMLGFRDSSEEKSHATRLTLMIGELLAECHYGTEDLDAISLSMGPGSYTGLRIGASVAKGMAYGLGVPLIGIPTLKVLANGFFINKKSEINAATANGSVLLCPMLDARRMEVYTALYNSSLTEVSGVEAVILDPLSFDQLLQENVIFFFGTGSNKAAEILTHPNARFFPGIELSAIFQSEPAELLFQSGEFLDSAYFEPHYLKEFIASIPKNKVLGL